MALAGWGGGAPWRGRGGYMPTGLVTGRGPRAGGGILGRRKGLWRPLGWSYKDIERDERCGAARTRAHQHTHTVESLTHLAGFVGG